MSSCCSPYADVADGHFDAKSASQELAAYRKSGPGQTARFLLDGLVAAGLAAGSVLDIGGGIGALTFELLDRGATKATLVDASSSYLAVATEEAKRRGRSGQVQLVQGDFVDRAAQLPRATIVTLDRVVCCYPDATSLLSRALDRTERMLALSYPRSAWYVRTMFAAGDLTRVVTRKSFRTFVHSPARMEQLIRAAGFTLANRKATWIWSADVYVRTAP